MSKKKILGGVTLAVVIISITSYFIILKRNKNKNEVPQISVEQILKERAMQAGNHLLTPMGKSFLTKNWVEFEKLYQPQRDFNELGEIIRASFIGNHFKDFKKGEIEKVFSYVLKTFDEIRSQDFVLTNLLITQFERLPTPDHGSPDYQKLESWYNDHDSSPAKKRMAVLKLGIQDSNPDPKWVSAVIQGITGKSFGLTHSSWIQMITEMRSIPARTKVLEALLRNFTKIDSEARPEALIALASSPTIAPRLIKKIFFKFLDSPNQKEFEAALKSMLPIFKENGFASEEVQKIRGKLINVPGEFKTPYVQLKVEELLKSLK